MGKRRKRTIRRPVPQTKKIDGKIYYHTVTFPKAQPKAKSTVEFEAEMYRRHGYLARVLERRWGYILYTRQK